MSQDTYKFIVSPENIQSDIVKINYNGEEIGVYSGMTQILTGGPNGTSLLTGLTINLLLRQTSDDGGYYSPFDGAILQKDVVSNFIFSSTTDEPYTFYVYNTSEEFQKFLDLSSYILDWGDGVTQTITTFSPTYLSHTYSSSDKDYVITLTQTNPWGVTKVEKKISTPFTDVQILNPNGTAFFISKGGNWSGTPISYNYIFSGDAENIVSAQTSNNYTTVPFLISGVTKSRISELQLYGTVPLGPPLYNNKYQIGTPIIANGQIWGALTNVEYGVFTAYTINQVDYYDYENGLTLFFEYSSGLTENNITAVPITKDEVLLKIIDQPQIQTNVFVERGKNSAYERLQRLGEVDNLGDMLNYGYGFYNVENKG